MAEVAKIHSINQTRAGSSDAALFFCPGGVVYPHMSENTLKSGYLTEQRRIYDNLFFSIFFLKRLY